jgi:hypothetical protein
MSKPLLMSSVGHSWVLWASLICPSLYSSSATTDVMNVSVLMCGLVDSPGVGTAQKCCGYHLQCHFAGVINPGSSMAKL